MCPGGINWCGFNWEAFATLVTGALAVGAAFYIGKKQTQLQKISVKESLFDRRYSVFKRTEGYILQILQHADQPDEVTNLGFFAAMGEAKFLFEPQVLAGLKAIKSDADNYLFENSHGTAEVAETHRLKILGHFHGLSALFAEMKLG